MNAEMESWVGKSIDDAIAAMGAAESAIAGSDGGTTYTWITIISDDPEAEHCRQKLMADSTGTIVAWSTKDCPLLAPIKINLTQT